MKVLVLGSTGMLGQAVMKELSLLELEAIGVARGTEVSFDVFGESFESLAERLSLTAGDYVVNCIGWIPQKATGDDSLDTRSAERLNVGFVEEIAKFSEAKKVTWIQIGTDCIFDGLQGGYSEDSLPSPIDLYGQTKLAGEDFVGSAIFLRCSIVGPDRISHSGLYEWFRSSNEMDTQITGFTNHVWNGVTTTAFAKLVAGLVDCNWKQPLNLHWIPRDQVTKADLLRLFARFVGADVGKVVEVRAARDVNRALTTRHSDLNEQLWAAAGYAKAPNIEELIREMVEHDLR